MSGKSHPLYCALTLIAMQGHKKKLTNKNIVVHTTTKTNSPQGLAEMMEVLVEVWRAFALDASAKRTETMCMPPPLIPRTMVQVEATGQTYKQVQSFTYLGDVVTEVPDEGFNDSGGRGYGDFAPGEVIKTAPSKDRTT